MTVNEYPNWFRLRFKHTSSFMSGLMLVFSDAVIIMLCFGISFFIVNLINHAAINFRSFVTYWVYLPAFLVVFYTAGLYPGIMLAPQDEVRRLSVCSLCCYTGIAISIAVETDGRIALIIALLLSVPFASILLPTARVLARKLYSPFKFWGVPAVLYSRGGEGNFIVNKLLKNPDYGYRPAMIINTEKGGNAGGQSGASRKTDYRGIPVFAPTEEIHKMIKKLNIKVAIIIESENSKINDMPVGNVIMNIFRYTILIPSARSIYTTSISVRDFGGIIAFSSTHNLTKKGNLFLKRFIDIFILLISSPLFLLLLGIISATIKLSSRGTVFYKHARCGKHGVPIKVWKFRSMVMNADEELRKLLETDSAAREEWEKNQKLKNDPRITKFGKFLRRTSLDELPQFFNILAGDMTFVGPRAVVQSELEKFQDKAEYILSVTPGLSGLWQISGRSETNYEERVMLDCYYIQNWSLWLDIWIIVQTLGAVLKGKGAY